MALEFHSNDDGMADVASLDPVVIEATKRFRRCAEWEAQCRQNFLEDYRFAHGDSDNGYQWPSTIRLNRDLDQRPCLTMNVVRQHNLQIVNEAKQNKSSVQFKATGGGASKASADLHNAMFRQVEYKSNAQAAYATACDYQVNAGWGYWRMVTEYENSYSFDQCFRIKRVVDPLSIYLDMDAQEKDKSDSRYGFVFDLVPDDDLLEAYPWIKDLGTLQPLGANTAEDSWNLKDHTRVCEYFRRERKMDMLVSFIDPELKVRKTLRKSKMPGESFNALKHLALTKLRPINEWEVQWFLIVGQKVVKRTIWPGQFIPLVQIIGEETFIDGILDRKGHTRSMKDAQRMYNYNASSQVEFVALQGKTPWIAAAQAIEEYENMWNTANTVNHSVLIYNGIDDEGNAIAPPERTQPPSASQAYESGMETAFNQMMMTSGQWQNQMGMGGNERTGEAISRRQEQGYTAVYHFQDNFADGLRYTGKQFLDIVPKIYDTPRLMKLQHEDGEDFDLELDPSQRQALVQEENEDNIVVRRVMNPQIGEYDVHSDVGPAYGTRREETVKAMTLLLTQNPALTSVIGDLLLSAMDFKESQEAAQRLKRMVPSQALGKGPTASEQQMMEQIKALNEALTKSMQKVGEQAIKLRGKEELRDVQAFDSETKRLAALKEFLLADPEGLAAVVEQVMQASLASKGLTEIANTNQGAVA